MNVILKGIFFFVVGFWQKVWFHATMLISHYCTFVETRDDKKWQLKLGQSRENCCFENEMRLLEMKKKKNVNDVQRIN